MCGVGEVERARDTDCAGCPYVCHRNRTSLLAAVGLRSLRGWGSSPYFGDRHRQIAEGVVSQLPPQFCSQKEDAPHGHAVLWKALLRWHPSSPSRTHSHPCQRGFCVSPANGQWSWPTAMTEDGKGMKNISSVIPIVGRVRKVTRRSPSITRRARYLPSSPELPGLRRYKIFSNKKKLDHSAWGSHNVYSEDNERQLWSRQWPYVSDCRRQAHLTTATTRVPASSLPPGWMSG